MGDKGTSYKEKKTSSVDNKTTEEDERRNVFEKGSGKGWSSASISSAGSSYNNSSPGNQSVVRKEKRIFKKGWKNTFTKERNMPWNSMQVETKNDKVCN
eukprot:14320321-Ditylum_brightwellii.AAC.1